MPGKIDASLNEKLGQVKWGEYKISQFLNWQPQKEIDPLKLDDLSDCTEDTYPFYGQATVNNGIISYNQLKREVLNNKEGKPTILIHSNNQNIVYVQTPFYLKDGHGATSVLQSEHLNRRNQMFIIAVIKRVIQAKYSYNHKATKIELKNTFVPLPVKNGEIDYAFMESFVAELEAERVAELAAYLTVSGFNNYELSVAERNALREYKTIKWKAFNLEKLFGKSTRGKRLKSADRIDGELPFVTAGEASEGISAHIGNEVEVFNENTTTIDMFGSAKYRSYKYGADDHIAVVHTDKLPMKASIFVTSAIHKASHTGKFDYGHNFYAKDADALDIMLPEKNGNPDYAYMEMLVSAVQKLVIKDVVNYSDDRINATKKVVHNH